MTAYFGLIPIMPLLSTGIHALSEYQLRYSFHMILLILVLIPALFGSNKTALGLAKGYSTFWLACCYIIGGILHRLYEEKAFHYSKYWTCLTVIICVILFFSLRCYEMTRLPFHNLGRSISVNLFHYYTSPGIVIISIMIFLFFVYLDIKQEYAKLCIYKVAQLTLGTYLLTVHPLVWTRFLEWHIDIQSINIINFIFLFVGLLICILTITFIIDALRRLIFKILHIYEICNYITTICRRQSVDRI